MLRTLGKPIRIVLLWQLAAGAVIALAAAWLGGAHGAASAGAGGAIGIVAGLVSALVASATRGRSAGGVLIAALRAEGVRLVLALLLAWLVLAHYDEARVAAFLGAFVVTMLIFSMAFFVREQ